MNYVDIIANQANLVNQNGVDKKGLKLKIWILWKTNKKT